MPVIGLLLIVRLLAASPEIASDELLSCTSKGTLLCAHRPDILGEVENANPWWDVLRRRQAKDGAIELAVERRRSLFDQSSLLFAYRFSAAGKLIDRRCRAILPRAGDRLMEVLDRGRLEDGRFVSIDPCRTGCLRTRGTIFRIDSTEKLTDPQPFEWASKAGHGTCPERVFEVRVPPVPITVAELSGTAFIGARALRAGDEVQATDVVVVTPRSSLTLRLGATAAGLGVAAYLTELHFVRVERWASGWAQIEERAKNAGPGGVYWAPPYAQIGSELWRVDRLAGAAVCQRLERAELGTAVLPAGETVLMGGFFEAPELHTYELGGLMMHWCADKRDD